MIYIAYKQLGERKNPKEQARYQSEQGICLLEILLKKYFSLSFDRKNIKRKSNGKPYLCEPEGIYFSISHSKDYVVCAVSTQEIGIDLEEIRDRKIENLAKKIMNPLEYKRWEQSINKQRDFYICWVKKESYVKWTGEGITCDLKEIPRKQKEAVTILLDEIDGYACAISMKANEEIQIEKL